MLTQTSVFVGPATVRRVVEGGVLVDVAGETRPATMALGYPYRPVPGDSLLVLGEDDLYVVGVLSGRGRTRLAVQGDLDLAASGTIRLSGSEGVEIRGRRVTLYAEHLDVWARSAVQRFVNCYQWVREALQVRAGRSRTMVEGTASLRAETIRQAARKDVRVDGTRIHLG